jgi:hypothetical protein
MSRSCFERVHLPSGHKRTATSPELPDCASCTGLERCCMFLGVPSAVLAAEVVRSERAGGAGRVRTLSNEIVPTMPQPVVHPSRDDDVSLEA